MATKKQNKKENKKVEQVVKVEKVCKSVGELIAEVCDGIKALLLAKNADYGNSALSYSGLATVDPSTGILIRMEDKIRRMYSLNENKDPKVIDESFEDTVKDLAGYCVLYLVSKGTIKCDLETETNE